MAGTLKNFYETLGVPRSATDEQIKTAYRKLILKFHPDKNVGDTYFEDWSKKIIEAFEVLSNPQLRSEYDQVYDEHKRAAKRSFQEEPAAPAQEPAAPFEARAPKPGNEPVTSDDFDFQFDTSNAVEDAHRTEQGTAPDAESFEAQALHYVAARQDYLRAEKDFKTAQKQQPAAAGEAAFISVVALCILLIAGSIVWIVKNPKDRVAAVPEGRVTEIPPHTAIVAAERAYFYKDPQNHVRTNDYLLQGMKVVVSKQYQNFYYGVFQSAASSNYKLTGWIKEDDLQQ